LLIKDVRAARKGLRINFNLLRNLVMISRSWSGGDVKAVTLAYEGFLFGFERVAGGLNVLIFPFCSSGFRFDAA